MTMKKWMLGCAIALICVNGIGVWKGLQLWEAHLKGQYPDAELVESPVEDTPMAPHQTLHWTWDLPVVSEQLIGLQLENTPVRFEPPVSGSFRWENDRVLRFNPSEPWPTAQRIQATLDTVLTNRHGRVHAVASTHQLVGPSLRVTHVDSSIRWEANKLQSRIQFNQAVDLKDVRDHVVLMDSKGQKLESTLQETPQPEEILLEANWRGQEKVTLIFQKGLPSVHGSAGALTHERVFHVKPPKWFAYQGRSFSQPTFEAGHVDLSFSSTPDLQTLQQSLIIEPSVKFSVGRSGWWRNNTSRISGDFTPGVRYKLTLGTGIKGVNGQALREPVSMELIFPERKPGIEFVHPGWILNAKGSGKIAVNAQNEEALTITLDHVHPNNESVLAVEKSGGHSRWIRPDDDLTYEVFTKTQAVSQNGVIEVDLSKTLSEIGEGVYRLTIRGKKSHNTLTRLLISSGVGLQARRYGDEFMVWAVSLADGKPAPDLPITLWSHTRQEMVTVSTNEDGLARMSVPNDKKLGRPAVILAKGNGRLGILSLHRSKPFTGPNGDRAYLETGYEAFVYSSRGIYRPAEKVHARCIVRGKALDLPGTFPFQWVLHNPSGQEVWTQQMTLSELGTSEVEIPLQSEWPNGRYTLSVGLPGEKAKRWGDTTFQIESFVPPQIVVSGDTLNEEEFVQGDRMQVDLQARMLFGGPAARHKGRAVVTLKPEAFRHSDYPEYSFSDHRKKHFRSNTTNIGKFETDEAGKAQLTVKLKPPHLPPSAMRAVVGLSVQEYTGRVATAFVSKRVDVVPYYLGVHSKVHENRLVHVNVVGLKPYGSQVSDSHELEVEWYRLSNQRGYRRDARGRYTYMTKEVAVSEGKRMVTLHSGKTFFKVPFEAEGRYRIAVRDSEANTSSTSEFWVGRQVQAPEKANVITIHFDQEHYQAGEEAVVQLRAPFAGTVLVTLEHQELLHQQIATLANGEGTVRIPVPDDPVSNFWVRAVLIRPQPEDGIAPVIRAEGMQPLRLDTTRYHQELVLEVADQLEPSSTVSLTVKGAPGAEVVIAAVDEGILRLTNYQTPIPHKWFTALRRIRSIMWDGFDDLLPELDSGIFAGDVQMGGGDGPAMMGKRLNPIDAKRFTPLTWWSGSQQIPADGKLTLEMEMPEFTGEVRWMAVQVGSQKLGSTEQTSKVSREVVTQQSLPLFLAPGDVSDWTVRLHNQSSQSRTILITPTVSGPLDVSEGALELTLKPGEQRLHRWQVQAGPGIGTSKARVVFDSGEDQWSDVIELAVRPVEAFQEQSKLRVLGPGEILELQDADEMVPGTLKHTVQISKMPSLQLDSAVQYLLRYPYGCLEQTVSSAAPALVMPEWATETTEGAKGIVEAGIQSLWRKQLGDGSFGYWGRRERTSVSGTFLALEFLLDAKEKGFQVHEKSLLSGIHWTERWLANRNWTLKARSKNQQLSHATLILAKAGQLKPGWVQKLRERKADLDFLSRVRCSEALVELGYRPEALDMLEGLTWESGHTSWDWWSPVSAEADFLRILIQIDPQDGRIPKLLERLLAKRDRQGRWAHTHENASVLKAFVAYSRAYGREQAEPNVQWLDPDGNEWAIASRKTHPVQNTRSRLVNRGKSPVYIEERIEGIPQNPPEVKNTFALERSLYRLNGEKIKSDETISSGEALIMVLHLSKLPQSMEHMVIDQRLPAGLEPLPSSQQRNPLALFQKKPGFTVQKPRHLEVRDDRVLFFPQRLNLRTHHFAVTVRAVTPGDYRFPAAFAQGMYRESVQSRSTETRIKVAP